MDACSRACVYARWEVRLAEPSKAERSSLEARSVCERAKLCMRSTGGRCNDFLQNQKMGLMTGTRAGALELKSQISQFPKVLSPRLLPATMWFQTFFDAIWVAARSIKCYRGLFFTSWVLCFNTLLPCISWPFFRRQVSGWSYDGLCALSAVSDDSSVQTTIIWREGIGSSNQDNGPGLETASRAHIVQDDRLLPQSINLCQWLILMPFREVELLYGIISIRDIQAGYQACSCSCLAFTVPHYFQFDMFPASPIRGDLDGLCMAARYRKLP